MATHDLGEPHETVRKMPAPPLTNCCVQDWPPSLVTKICAPTATQSLPLAQLTPPSAPKGNLVDGADHVTPPSFDVTMVPLTGPPSLGVTPTATQVVEPLGQLTPSSAALS